jgi:DNA-binding Lrp family transcriptional regulator
MSDLTATLDEIDRRIINALQGGFPVSEQPFAETAAPLGISEDELIRRIDRLVTAGVLSRFGPLYNAERLGGAVTLAAMSVPEAKFEQVTALVNAHPEVAHNYARQHRLNMWFVVAADRAERIAEVLALIEAEAGLPVLDMPKMEEFFIGLRLAA